MFNVQQERQRQRELENKEYERRRKELEEKWAKIEEQKEDELPKVEHPALKLRRAGRVGMVFDTPKVKQL